MFNDVPLVIVDSDGHEVSRGEASLGLLGEAVVVMHPDVPKEPEVFAAWLEDWLREHNPDHYAFRAVEAVPISEADHVQGS